MQLGGNLPRKRLEEGPYPQKQGNFMFAAPATLLSGFATVLAVLVMIYTLMQVGKMRGRHKINAPAMTGHPELERAIRVQMNTIEQFVIFLPLLWLATIYFRNTLGWLPAALGFVWCLGRIIYSMSYMAAPEKRTAGFMITVLASIGLLILSVYGMIVTWMAATAA
jgi:glutathione S-transferase